MLVNRFKKVSGKGWLKKWDLDLGLRTWTWLDVSVARLRVEEGSHVQCTVKILFVG